VSSVAEARRLDFGNRSRRQLVADLQVKHAANGKERRAHMVRRRSNSNSNGRNNSNSGNSNNNNSSSSRSSGNGPPHLAQPSAGKDKGAASRRVEIENNPKKRHRHRRDKFVGITAAAPE
jgi:hypothetical protein